MEPKGPNTNSMRTWSLRVRIPIQLNCSEGWVRVLLVCGLAPSEQICQGLLDRSIKSEQNWVSLHSPHMPDKYSKGTLFLRPFKGFSVRLWGPTKRRLKHNNHVEPRQGEPAETIRAHQGY